jgi:hypothetical protein
MGADLRSAQARDGFRVHTRTRSGDQPRREERTGSSAGDCDANALTRDAIAWHSNRSGDTVDLQLQIGMGDWQPYREPLRVTLTRTLTMTFVAAACVAPWAGGLRRWPLLCLLILWPSFGGHWIDLLFLNWLRPRLPSTKSSQRVARIGIWFVGGAVLALGVRLTAQLLQHARMAWLTLVVGGGLFIAIELVTHAALHLRGRPSFYNGLG